MRPVYKVKETYLGEGDLDSYTFDFKIENSRKLEIIMYDEEKVLVKKFRGDDEEEYANLVFDKIRGGGTLTLLEDLPVGYTLCLLLADDEPTQTYEFDNKTSFNLKKLEMSLDNALGAIQRLTYKVSQSLRISDANDEQTFNGQLPFVDSTVDQGRILALNETGDGFSLGPTVSHVQSQVDGAEAARIAAETARNEAVTAQTEAENAAGAAELFSLTAEDFKNETEEFRDETEVIREETEAYASLFLFDNIASVSDVNSPFVVEDVDDSTLYLTDDTDGPVQFILPDLAILSSSWHIAVMKQSEAASAILITPYPGQTINGDSLISLSVKGIGVAFFKESDTNWSVKYLPFTDSGSSLPAGGGVGAVLTKTTSADNDFNWDDFIIEGWSTRFNMQWNSIGLRDAIMKILAIVYQAASVTLSGSSNTLREKGTVVSSITLSANVTKRSNNIAKIRFIQGATEIANFEPPTNTGSGTTTTPYETDFSDNITFTVEVTDEIVSGEGGTMVTSNVSYSFVYPYYHGCAAPARTPAQVATLTKSVITSNANLNRVFNSLNGDVYYFAYPASYGVLTSIADENGFEVFGSFTRRVEDITGLDGTPVSYNIYESNNPVTAGTTNFTFKR